ncbi:MAG TPA: outer membrane protein transport protein [Pseudomonadales bacterium]|nr:outer membrane protein transport protein [Pseudomonadales bacterium]
MKKPGRTFIKTFNKKTVWQYTVLASVFVLAATASHEASATDGYFSNGYGVKSQGIGGIGIALPQDALAAASNPAGTARVGNRLDVGVSLFRPQRGAEISGSPVPGANGKYEGNDTSTFIIPDFGYTQQLSDKSAYGVAVYGNGGMNTDYKRNPYAAFGSAGKAGVNLEQLFVTPSYAYKLDDNNAIGVGLNLAYQRFQAKGLSAFAGSSSSPANLTNRGVDTATGAGLRLGWTGDISDDITLGATWASRIQTSGFDKYKGLFAEKGGFDIPGNYGAGIAWRATPALTLASDYQRILYSQVDSVGQPLSNLFAGNPLGSKHGPGFGWEDINVYKIGASYALNDSVTLRTGYTHSDQPVPKDQTFFNILAPGVVQEHYTVGATWKIGEGELSAAYVHAPQKTVHGRNSIPAPFGGGEADVHLEEDILGVSYALKL